MSREEAIKMLNDIGKYLCSGNPVWDTNKVAEAIRTAIVDMRMVPKFLEAFKAQPERKPGKWIYKNDLKQFFCSECGYPSLTYDDTYIYGMDLPNYCEDCGADMRGEQDE